MTFTLTEGVDFTSQSRLRNSVSETWNSLDKTSFADISIIPLTLLRLALRLPQSEWLRVSPVRRFA